jgi:hypothetical protein
MPALPTDTLPPPVPSDTPADIPTETGAPYPPP